MLGDNPISKIAPFLWDVDVEKVDIQKHKRFIIERLLQYGTEKEIRWLWRTYNKDDIVEVVEKSKNIDRMTANFWSIHYNIPRERILCFNRQLTQDYFY